jgi:putative membrane protein
MLIRLLLRLVLLAVIIGFVAWLTPGVHFHGGFLSLLWVALLLALVNTVIGPLVRLISAPLILLTLGLFLLIIDAALFALTAWLTSDLDVDNFGSALLAGFLIAVFGWLAEVLVPIRRRRN